MNISRRDFIKGATAGTVSLVTMGLLGCSNHEKSGDSSEGEVKKSVSLTPGVYSSTVKGYKGDITVTCTFSEDSIIQIEVADAMESEQFGAKALAVLPQRVIDHQSVNIDGFAGATVTSGAFKSAIRNCIEQASGNKDSFDNDIVYKVEEDELTCDVVVVGSGISGQAAALRAAEEGAKVIMLDKLSITGGAATGSGGAILAANSCYSTEEEGNTNADGLVENLYRYSEEKANLDLIKFIVSKSGEMIDWYVGYGIDFEVGQCYGTPIHYAHRAIKDGVKSGSNIFNKVFPAFKKLGGTAIVDTRATSLIQDENGKIIGINATNREHNFKINCKAVVLAAGGYENDAERLAEWSPNCGKQMVDTLCHAGDSGDGILMGLEAGGVFVGSGYAQTTAAYNPLAAIKVTEAGKRYCDEMHSEEGLDQGHQFKAFYDANAQVAYTLFCDGMPNEAAQKMLEKAKEAGGATQGPAFQTLYTGNTLEEVAQAAGVDAQGLKETVAHWNEMVDNGKDEDYGLENVNEIGKYEEGPFYLLPWTMVINGTVGGLKINFNSEVLDKNGNAIEGLYAAGETCNGEFYYRLYPSGGASLMFGSVTGRIAGENAARISKA